MSTAQAAGNFVQSVGAQNNGVYASQYNPWRPQPKQWGYGHNNNGNGNAERSMPQPLYSEPLYSVPLHAVPLAPIPARQYEYRRYIQEVNPYYDMSGGLPWWAGSGAAPYGPAMGNGWPNGIW